MATCSSHDHDGKSHDQHDSDDPINDEKEREHFRQVVQSFHIYNFYATKRVTNRLKHFRDLTPAHKSYLFDFEDNCRKLIDCIKHNDKIIDLVLKDVDQMFENTSRDLVENEEKKKSRDLKAHQDVDRVYTTLKQIVRDWSSDGERERACCYGPIINELKTLYPQESNVLNDIKVLVPGAGLGRLAFEIAVLGFKAQGNEFSLHMLMVSNFILNKCRSKNQYKVYPYVNTWCNNWSFDNQLKPVNFPDVSPYELISDSFSFAAGDFLDVYVDKNEWDSVVTCFFIDTAHNVIEYVEKIWSILKPNGYWINFGPLLYHFADTPNEQSIELSYDQLKHVIKAVGFKFLKEELNMPSTYLENTKSMLKYSYECVFFVVQKPAS